jgi:hypothetical protein
MSKDSSKPQDLDAEIHDYYEHLSDGVDWKKRVHEIHDQLQEQGYCLSKDGDGRVQLKRSKLITNFGYLRWDKLPWGNPIMDHVEYLSTVMDRSLCYAGAEPEKDYTILDCFKLALQFMQTKDYNKHDVDREMMRDCINDYLDTNNIERIEQLKQRENVTSIGQLIEKMIDTMHHNREKYYKD